MTIEELKKIAHDAGALVVKVIPLKKRTGDVVLQLSFFCPSGKKELDLPNDVAPLDAATAIKTALVG